MKRGSERARLVVIIIISVLLVIGGFSVLVSFPNTALAQQEAQRLRCGEQGSTWIRLRTEGLGADFRARLLLHIRSSLAARHIDVCVVDEGSSAHSQPLATLEVTRGSTPSSSSSSSSPSPSPPTDLVDPILTTMTIHVDDGVTHKRVARDLDLSGIPPDGRALSVALALDELLRASWAELMLEDAQAQRTAAPKVALDAIGSRDRAPVASPSAPAPKDEDDDRGAAVWEIAAALGGEHFGGGHDQLGADVLGSYAPPWSRRLAFQTRLGFRSGFAVDAPRGEIHSTALILAAGPRVALFPREERAGVDVMSEVLFARVTFVATSKTANVTGNEVAVPASYLLIGTRLWYVLVRRPSLRAFAQVGGGVPLHTAYAKDGDARITGLGGALLAGELGLSWYF